MDSLPEDWILEILVRVRDPKTFARCGSVCRLWGELVAQETTVQRRRSKLLEAVGASDTQFATTMTCPGGSWSKLSYIGRNVRGSPIWMLFDEVRHFEVPRNPRLTLVNVNFGIERETTISKPIELSIPEFCICTHGWREFLEDSHISSGDKVDIYTGRRGANKEPLLLFFNRGGSP